jgi:hypothetical protein
MIYTLGFLGKQNETVPSEYWKSVLASMDVNPSFTKVNFSTYLKSMADPDDHFEDTDCGVSDIFKYQP